PLRYPHLRQNKTHHYLLAFRGQPTLSFRRQRFYIKDWAAVDTLHYTSRSIAHYHRAFFQNEAHASVHLPNSVQIRPRYGRKSHHWQFFPMYSAHARAIYSHRPIRNSVGKTTNCWAKGIWAACGRLHAPDRNDLSRAPPLQADPRVRIFRECAVSAAARLGEPHRSGGWHSRWRPLVFLPTFERPARAHFASLAGENTSRHKSVAHRANRSH